LAEALGLTWKSNRTPSFATQRAWH